MSFWSTFAASEAPIAHNEVADIKYHLTKLLEAEAPLTSLDDRLTQVNCSNIKFGIEDIQLLSANLDKAQLALKIESWVRSFEPRFCNVSVELVDRKETENAVFFNIIASIPTEFGEKELIFDSKIALADLTTQLKEENYD
ncbi:GPW/gp25 family protein [Vibrio tapetis]|uniref:IraD/Gp25-like domain-containing protein n=1 Tax=Vibrio tapetis subsp. tapetis TaxID=1671868 RepID=A0A2N8ZJR4_9VIBR|nr:GPW/gp25 family protein [Vibrio tapetis]SON52137.1 conserved protein of unknown function [Vibrio tapetis subsp. tapetis]